MRASRAREITSRASGRSPSIIHTKIEHDACVHMLASACLPAWRVSLKTRRGAACEARGVGRGWTRRRKIDRRRAVKRKRGRDRAMKQGGLRHVLAVTVERQPSGSRGMIASGRARVNPGESGHEPRTRNARRTENATEVNGT